EIPFETLAIQCHFHGSGCQVPSSSFHVDGPIRVANGFKTLGYGTVVKVAGHVKTAIERVRWRFVSLTEQKKIGVDSRRKVPVRRLPEKAWFDASVEAIGVEEA